MKRLLPVLVPLLTVIGFACSPPPTPKPFGYLRIDPPEAGYIPIAETSLPFIFHISEAAELYSCTDTGGSHSLNIIYPDYGATFFCAFLNDADLLHKTEADCRRLVALHTVERFSEHAFSDPEAAVHATLFLLDGNSPTPIRFHLTDSVSRIFHGTLLYDAPPNADSLTPVTAFLTEDIIELIQSFRWR
ncbi:MAG: gliding motility protein GldD [Tannerellaceae bacterium]|jgi:gliding motility-associated lipoprotein GldD|nr:gliding motility protein GldD [Tannerellaceae bacterium]